MINFEFRLENPFSNRWDMLYLSSKLLGKHKAVEANIYRTNTIISISLKVSIKGDHAGIHIMGGVLGYEGELHFYDTRHWDYEKNTWCTYNR
jgi:hypothetical protein